MPFMLDHGDLLVETRGALGLITLNRPSALNALNEAMVSGIQHALDAFARDSRIQHILIRGAGGKAFSAGGDIRQIYEMGQSGRHQQALDFWHLEYRLNACIHHFSKPYIALIDGIVMGGGVGVSLHGSHRFAGPNMLFAMPEVGIGFFPDVGASYALPRLPGASGAYLGITGARINRADAMALGLATHSVQAGAEDEIIAALASGETADVVAARFYEPSGDAPINAQRNWIDRHFAKADIPAILASLEAEAASDAPIAKVLAGMRRKSPMSMAIALEQIRRGADMTFDAVMEMEFRIVSRIVHGHDFYEGVRAVIIDKDNSPRWSPADIANVDQEAVQGHFAPLAVELDLSTRSKG